MSDPLREPRPPASEPGSARGVQSPRVTPPDPDPDPAGDLELMGRVARGDREAFATLYDRHGNSIMGFLYRLAQDRGLAEDLTQETFLRAWRAAPRWEPRARVLTWLYLIARRLWWHAAARRRTRREGLRALAEREAREAAPGPAPPEWLARREAARQVERALAGLSPRLRLLFVLVRLQGLSLAEAAQVAGIPVGTAKSRIAAAELALRRALKAGEPG